MRAGLHPPEDKIGSLSALKIALQRDKRILEEKEDDTMK